MFSIVQDAYTYQSSISCLIFYINMLGDTDIITDQPLGTFPILNQQLPTGFLGDQAFL